MKYHIVKQEGGPVSPCKKCSKRDECASEREHTLFVTPDPTKLCKVMALPPVQTWRMWMPKKKHHVFTSWLIAEKLKRAWSLLGRWQASQIW